MVLLMMEHIYGKYGLVKMLQRTAILKNCIILVFCASNVLSQLLVHKNDIEVPIGREVFLKPSDLYFHHLILDEICKVEVLENEPITQRVGLFEPRVFDCNFKSGTVKYTHYGSPLLSEDTVKLRAYKFLKRDTLVQYFDITFIIRNVSYNVIQPVKSLVVNEYFGETDVINESVINFNYSHTEGTICKAKLTYHFGNRPAHGQVIGKDKRPVDVIKRKCDEFLHLGLRYEHLKPPSPNIDYVVIFVEVSDPELNNGELVVEWYYLPVEILPGFPNLPPKASFSGMYLMDVDQFIITAITPAVLSATDSETPYEELVFNISKPLHPQQGSLVHLSDHTRPITSFRQADLNSFSIAYKPPTKSFKERQMFEVIFTIYDSDYASSEPCTLHVAIRPAVTSAPRVSMNVGMVLLEGQSRPLRLNNLEIVDNDNINDVQIFVTGGLHHGKLEVAKRTAISFTQNDIVAGRVVYHHDDSDSIRDSIHLRIYDGSQSTHTKFPITIIPKDDNAPTLVANVGIKVREGQNSHISSSVLRAMDHDTPDENINFLITKNPIVGTVWKKFPWEKDGKEIHQFTQRDINKGLIYYHHFGEKVFTDSFDVVIQDVNNPPNASPPYKIAVEIAAVGDDPPSRDPSSSFSLEVQETKLGVLESSVIHYVDGDSPDKAIVYTITSEPRFIGSFAHKDTGKLVSIVDESIAEKNLNLLPVTSFTQEHINHRKLAYMPPMDDIGANQLHLQFIFSVSDNYGNTVTGQQFNITVIPVNNQVPQLHTGELLVEEGSSTLISTNELSVYDPDTLTTDLQLSLFTVPLHGSVRRSGQPLRVGDLLSLNDILTLRLEYVHDGTEFFKDSFKVGVNDGLHFVSGEVFVHIEPVDDEMPVWQTHLLQRLSVEEGGSVQLTSQVLSATDVDTDDSLLFFILTEVSQFGSIFLDGRKTTRFTQEDVMKEKVLYMHSGLEIGPTPKEDVLTFIVTDKAFPRQTHHHSRKLFITVLPQNNRPPRISFKRAILVEEGKRSSITEENISASDDDTFPSELLIVISKQPQYGYLENLKPIAGYERNTEGKKISAFPLLDIKNGYISFVQSNHRNIEPESDGFEVFVTDGVQNSSSVYVFVSIILQNDEEPTFYLANVTILEGAAFVFNSSTISASDRDVPGDILVISVKSKPTYGVLSYMVQTINDGPFLEVPLSEVGIDNFENVVYRHGGQEEFSDLFTLVLSDGAHSVLRTCYVKIIPVNDEPPKLVKNVVASNANMNGSVILSGALLLAEDIDTPPDELVYSVLSPCKFGSLQRKQNSTIGEAVWIDVESFSQGDVDLNLVRYHQGLFTSMSEEDNFSFLITDGIHETLPATFTIKIVETKKINLSISANEAVVQEGSHVVFDSSSVYAWDGTSHFKDIVFHVIQEPNSGMIMFSNDTSTKVSSFSLLDLLNGLVLYRHTDLQGSQNDGFKLTVTNGAVSKNFSVVVRIIPSSTSPNFPTLKILSPLLVDQNDYNSQILTSQNLFMYDPFTPDNEIVYTLSMYLRYGVLFHGEKQTAVHSFSQQDINKKLISYDRRSSVGSTVDQFSFKVTNGKVEGYKIADKVHQNPTVFEVHMKPTILQEDPVVYVNSPVYLEIFSRSRQGFTLSSDHLKATFANAVPSELEFHVMTYPQNSYIFHKETETVVRVFTQEEIDHRRILLVVSEEPKTSDYFTFHIAVGNTRFDKEFRMDFKWSVVYFSHPEYSVCENAGDISITVHRDGNLDISTFVRISAVELTAKENLDYLPGKTDVVQFDPGSTEVTWNMRILKDDLEEAPIEQLQVVLSQPENTILISYTQTLISIYDFNRGECAHLTSYGDGLPDSVRENVKAFSTEIMGIDEGQLETFTEVTENPVLSHNMMCSQRIYGLLQYNHTTDALYQCNGNEWILWNPDSTEGQSFSTDANTGDFKIPVTYELSRTDVYTEEYQSAISTVYTTEHEASSTGADITEYLVTMVDFTTSKPDDAKTTARELETAGSMSSESSIDSSTTATSPPLLLDCPQGWELFGTGCFKFFKQQLSWNSAQDLCKDYDFGHLVQVDSGKHNNWLLELAHGKAFWTGLHALPPGDHWNYNPPGQVSFMNWKKGSPRFQADGGLRYRCVLVKGKGFWINRPCDNAHNFICSFPADDQSEFVTFKDGD